MPKDLATRISYFYCASALSGAFSGLLAAAIANMDGVGGYEGWRWIFLLEGIVTVILGIACFFLLIDSPALSTKWLEPDEIRFLELQKFIKDGGRSSEEEEEHFRWKDLKMVLCNWRLYMQAYILLCISACSYGRFYFFASRSAEADLNRHEVHSSHHYEVHGFQQHERSAHERTAVRRRRNKLSGLRPPL
jgi:MFS family permease